MAGDDGGERSDAWAASYHPTVGGAHGGGEGGGGGEDAGGGGGGGGGVFGFGFGFGFGGFFGGANPNQAVNGQKPPRPYTPRTAAAWRRVARSNPNPNTNPDPNPNPNPNPSPNQACRACRPRAAC